MKIHKEGYRVIIVAAGILVVANGLLAVFSGWLALVIVSFISLLFLLFVMRFFRIPQRKFVTDENAVISPADGQIVVIEKTNEEEYFKGERLQISVFMSIWDVHINWFPVGGIIKYFRYHPGKYLVARYPKSSNLNERTSVVLEDENGRELLVRQIAGAVARRIITYAPEGSEVKQSEEMGFIRFGSRLDVFLPSGASVKVKKGEFVKGGKTILASWG
jgi:phosphatidylserine decarboxylase